MVSKKSQPARFTTEDYVRPQERVERLEQELHKEHPRQPKGVVLVHDVSGSMSDFVDHADVSALLDMNRNHLRMATRERAFDEICLSTELITVDDALSDSAILFGGTDSRSIISLATRYKRVYFYTDDSGAAALRQCPPNIKVVVLFKR